MIDSRMGLICASLVLACPQSPDAPQGEDCLSGLKAIVAQARSCQEALPRLADYSARQPACAVFFGDGGVINLTCDGGP